MRPCLTLSIIRYGSRVKWSNPGKGVVPSLHLGAIAIEKGGVRLPSTMAANLPNLNIYVCVCVCVYMHMYAYICVSIYICIHICVYIYMYIYIYTHTHTHTHTHICVCVCVCILWQYTPPPFKDRLPCWVNQRA